MTARRTGSRGVELIMRSMFAPICGSQLLRAWCCDCGEPMRISVGHAKSIAEGHSEACCERCSPRLTLDKGNVLTPRQAAALGRTRS
jgi:hypothetical protein